MSGHSHFSTIKHKKEATDKKRGQNFSKLARLISIAVKEKGSNPETNSKLRIAIETARSFNMPRENVDRAIKKGTGELSDEKLEEVFFEAYGPAGIAIIIEGITDNKNRALGEIKQILSQSNGKLAGDGSVKWMFDRKGVVIINLKMQTEILGDKEKMEMMAIEAGADDINWDDDNLEIFTKIESLEGVKNNLESKSIKIESASVGWVAKENISLDSKNKEACENLFSALDENDAVQEIYSNLKT
jgi:YebC/PmpR family DNA-binding regulatory protein